MERHVFLALVLCSLSTGCSIGPRALEHSRLRYNEAVKRTTQEQLLLNIVRLRYTDSPSSLGVTSIAAQHEIVKSLKLIPLLAASGDAVPQPFSRVLPQVEVNAADRPTLSYTPLDDQDFTKRLFTPIPLDGVIYLSKTTWKTSTVFRLWLENLNWVSNAETASGPTPPTPPNFAEFRSGMDALQHMLDRKVVAFFNEEQEESISAGLPTARLAGNEIVEAAKAGYEFRKDDKRDSWTLVKKKSVPHLRVHPEWIRDPDLLEFCRIFRLKPGLKSYEIVADKIDPFFSDRPKEGVNFLDLETRSLLQVLYFVSHGVDVPCEHLQSGQAPATREHDGRLFDWDQVLDGLFKVHVVKCRHRPANAHVSIQYQGYWFYIDNRDRDTKATFALLVDLSRIELGSKIGASPILTIPLGGR